MSDSETNGNGHGNGNGNGNGREDWFEQPGDDGAPVRFVERRQGGRRHGDMRIMGEMPPSVLPTQSVSLIIPTMNEARNVGDVLDRLPAMVTEVVLVDASSDVTKLMARNSRPDIRIIGEPAPGKGNALRAGLAAARGDVLVAMDADGSMSPEEIPRFVHPAGPRFRLHQGLPLHGRRWIARHHAGPAAGQPCAGRSGKSASRRPLHRPVLRILRATQDVPGVPRPPFDGIRDRD